MTILTTGIPGNLVARQEIRIMMQDQDLFTIYLLALERLQKTPQTDFLSWYQIAGIHGRPYTVYDGSGKVGNPGTPAQFGGYCTHSSILFPPWHRPYLALYEQILGKHVNDIANEYPAAVRPRYIAAAQRFRIPYWDWAANSDVPDVISRQHQVTVNGPQGSKILDPNPLYTYHFNPMPKNFGDGLPPLTEKKWESYLNTLRWPTNATGNAVSQDDPMDRNLGNQRLFLRDRVYNLITQSDTYEAFSNDGFPGPETDPRYYDSLEAIHGTIHDLLGRGGHMGVPDFAAFDPIFWLHHTQVDRIFAIWQAIHPDLYVVPRSSEEGTFTTRVDTVEDEGSNLTPFWKSQGVYWTSADVRDTRDLHYTYPELAKWSTLTPEQKSVRLRTDVNAMYGKSAPWAAINPGIFTGVTPSVPTVGRTTAAAMAATTGSPRVAALSAPAAKVAAAGGQPAQQQPMMAAAVQRVAAVAPKVVAAVAEKVPDTASAPIASHNVATSSASHGTHKQHYYEWIANITVEKHTAKTTFAIYVFLGDFNPDPTKWGEDPNLIGTHVIFANDIESTGCERCHHAAAEHKLVTGTVPLTGALGDRLGKDKLASLRPAEITPYLQRELHWRIQNHDSQVIERADIPSLNISVAHVPVTLPNSIHEFPVWGDAVKHAAVTTGRPGGASD